jgi:hypothetical protein
LDSNICYLFEDVQQILDASTWCLDLRTAEGCLRTELKFVVLSRLMNVELTSLKGHPSFFCYALLVNFGLSFVMVL